MKSTPERLIPVLDFKELRAGMIVVLRKCRNCGASKHRGMLVRRDVRSDGHEWHPAPAFCHNDSGINSVVTSLCITERRLFRVYDGLESLETLRRLELTR